MPTMPTNTNHPGKSGRAIAKALLIVTIIGAVNWGLVGFFQFNLVHAIFGGAAPEQPSGASRVVYAIVGLAGLAMVSLLPKLHFEARPTTDLADRSL